MSDIRIEPPTPVSGAAAVHAVRPPDRSPGAPGNQQPVHALSSTVAASTSGGLHAAYAQFVVDPDTHDVVVRVRDTVTDALIVETPSKEIQQMHKFLKDYAQTMARRRTALGTTN
jgi:hypothetical protein